MQKKAGEMTETLAHGTHLRVLSKSYPMNTNMIRFRLFSKIFASLCLDETSLISGRVNVSGHLIVMSLI